MKEKAIQEIAFENARELESRREELKKFALDFYEKCKSKNMTINEFNLTMDFLKSHMSDNAVVRD